MKIVIMESLAVGEDSLNELKRPFEQQGHRFECFARTADTEKMIAQAKDADAMIIANMPLPAQVIAGCEKLKFIDVAFAGVDHVAMDKARELGITVSNAVGYSTQSVAELGVAMTLSLLRNLTQVEQRCRRLGTKDGLVGNELMGKTVGILGLGNIGRRSAQLYNAFGCRVIAHSRTTHPDCPSYVTEVGFDELLQQSDVLVLHCPLNNSTRGLINAKALAKMKPSAILVNLARGPVCVSADLAAALNNGVIAAAAIDVFDKEPPLSADEPLLSAKNTLLTPHVAFATAESMVLRAQIVFENLSAWLNGTPQNVCK